MIYNPSVKKLFLLLLLSLGLSAISYASESNYSSEGKKTLYDQMDSIGPTMSGYDSYMSTWKHAFKVVEKPYPVRYGTTSERYELREGDCYGWDCENMAARSELVLQKQLVQARYNQDIWYGWSFYNETIPTIGLYNVIGQWKNGMPTSTGSNNPMLVLRQTPLKSSIWYWCDNSFCSRHLKTQDNWDVFLQLGKGGKFKSQGNSNNWNSPCRLFSMEENQGKWVDIVINTNFGTDEDGYVNIWINGNKRCEYRGVIQDYIPSNALYPGPSHRRGVFINNSKMTSKTLPTLIAYYDEFRIGKSRKEVDIRMIEDPNYQPPKDKCAKGFINTNDSCTVDTVDTVDIVDISNKYDGQYTMYLYRSYPGSNDKNIVNATIEIKGGFVKVSDNSDRWIHRKIDDPLDSLKGEVDTEGNLNWSMEIDPWKKSQFIHKVIFGGILNNDEPITGKYDEGTVLRIELKKKD
jgi:hypothetical protein